MIADGALETPKVDAVIGQHVDSFNDVGLIFTIKGVMTAASDRFFINLRGKGSHTADPHLGIDTTVVGATCEYNRNTFVVTKDNKHPSLLAGYMASLMTYCAITGEKAEGQPYGFFTEVPALSVDEFVKGNYKTSDKTNFDEIMNSSGDMKGIQKLIDKYLAQKSYKK